MIRLPMLVLRHVGAAVAFLCGLAACAVQPTQAVDNSPQRSVLIYGYVDMSQAPVSLSMIGFRQLEPQPQDPNGPIWYLPSTEGYFYGSGLPLGRYILAEVGGQNCLLGWLLCGDVQKFPYISEDPGFRIKKPGLYYFGSIRFIELSPGNFFIGPRRYKLQAEKSPSEREVLMKIMPRYENGPWKPILEARLRELSK